METLLATVRRPAADDDKLSLNELAFRFKPGLAGFTPVYQNVTDLAAFAGAEGNQILENLRLFCGSRQILWGPSYTELSASPLIRFEFLTGAERDHYQAAYNALAARISKDEWRFPRPDSSFRMCGRPQGDASFDFDPECLSYAAPLISLLDRLAKKLGAKALEGVTIRDGSTIEFNREPARSGAAKPALTGLDFSAADRSASAWPTLSALAVEAMTFEFFTTLLREKFLAAGPTAGEKPVEEHQGYRDYWRRNEKDLLIPRTALDAFLSL